MPGALVARSRARLSRGSILPRLRACETNEFSIPDAGFRIPNEDNA
jgi:hypothetical protein